jgi:hypothetical protein
METPAQFRMEINTCRVPTAVKAPDPLAALQKVEEWRAVAPAAGGPKPLAIDLSAQFAQMGDGD